MKTLKQVIGNLRHFDADSRLRYKHTAETFNAVLGALSRLGSRVTPAQADCLYRVMRFEGKMGIDAKHEYIGKQLGTGLANRLELNRGRRGSGLIGGALGTIRTRLRSNTEARRLVEFLVRVREASNREKADQIVQETLRRPWKGLGISVISSFLFAVRPKDYPIVNDGVMDGLKQAVAAFHRTKDVSRYFRQHVLRLRVVAEQLGFKDFASFDEVFLTITDDGIKIRPSSRIEASNSEESRIENKVAKLEEGHRRSAEVEMRSRNAKARLAALDRGYRCQICGFDFERTYGELGSGYAEVHHLKMISRAKEVRRVDPEKDLLVVCSNCHRMLHRDAKTLLSWKRLKSVVEKRLRQRR